MLKEWIGKLSFLSLCIVTCFPLWNMKVGAFAIILFTALSLVAGFSLGSALREKVRVKELLILLIPFILIFLRTWVFDRTEQSLFYLEVSLSMLAFPVSFFLVSNRISKKQFQILSWIFVASTLIIVTYGELKASMRLLEHLGPHKHWKTFSAMLNDVSFPYYMRTAFEEAVVIHPTYATLFLGICLLILTDFLLKEYRSFLKWELLLLGFLIAFIILLQVILASRTPFIASMAGILLLFFLHVRKKVVVLYALGVVLFVSSMLIVLVPTFGARFKEISFQNTQMPTDEKEDSYNLRVGIYTCSVEVISQNWLLGVGPGNVQQNLNQCYNRISTSVYEEKNYNTHNQFLDYWAGLGIAGPLSLLTIFGYYMFMNLKRRNLLAVSIGLFFFIAFLTENFLTRQNGIVPFAYFIGLYFFSRTNDTKTIS